KGVTRAITEPADFLRTLPANQKLPGPVCGSPPCAEKHRRVVDRVPLRDAILPVPRAALRYRGATFPRNGRAKTARKRTQPRAADTPDPLAVLPERIVLSSPWRKRSLPKSVSASSSTAGLALPSSQLPTNPVQLTAFRCVKLLPGYIHGSHISIFSALQYHRRSCLCALAGPLWSSPIGLTAPFSRLLRFGLKGGLRSIEIDRETFRRYLSRKHGINVNDFRHLRYMPVDRLDAVAKVLIRDAQRFALLE